VNLQRRAVTRSEEGKEETKPIVLQREPEALTIRLPFGSREGVYEFQIAKSADQPLLAAVGEERKTSSPARNAAAPVDSQGTHECCGAGTSGATSLMAAIARKPPRELRHLADADFADLAHC